MAFDLEAVLSRVCNSRCSVSFRDYVASFLCPQLAFVHTQSSGSSLPYFILKSALFSGLRGWGGEWVDNSGPWTYLDGSRVGMSRGTVSVVLTKARWEENRIYGQRNPSPAISGQGILPRPRLSLFPHE